MKSKNDSQKQNHNGTRIFYIESKELRRKKGDFLAVFTGGLARLRQKLIKEFISDDVIKYNFRIFIC